MTNNDQSSNSIFAIVRVYDENGKLRCGKVRIAPDTIQLFTKKTAENGEVYAITEACPVNTKIKLEDVAGIAILPDDHVNIHGPVECSVCMGYKDKEHLRKNIEQIVEAVIVNQK